MNPVDPQIERYLNRLARPLERTLDARGLEEVRMEALFHLESLVARERSRGLGEEHAVAAAIAEYGSAEIASAGLLDEWCRGRQAMTFARGSSSAFWWSFAHFGIAFGTTLLLIETQTMWPGAAFLSTEEVVGVFAFVAPLLAGVATGWRVPTGNLRALLFAFTPLVPYTALVGAVTAPFIERDLLVNLLLGWAAVGALSVVITAWLRRHGRPSESLKALS
ncbi:MAG: hypothetical protein ACO1SV_19065 [Fimbriimonas sp.]